MQSTTKDITTSDLSVRAKAKHMKLEIRIHILTGGRSGSGRSGRKAVPPF
jgi:hypothetical protein